MRPVYYGLRPAPNPMRHTFSVRKELKIRPGFTPQEDVGRFKTSRQAQSEANKLPKGHIVGWVAPSSQSTSTAAASTPTPKVATVDADGNPLSKAALKNAKRKAKKIAEAANKPTQEEIEEEERLKKIEGEKEKVEDAPDAWDEDDGDEVASTKKGTDEVDSLTKGLNKLDVGSK